MKKEERVSTYRAQTRSEHMIGIKKKVIERIKNDQGQESVQENKLIAGGEKYTKIKQENG